MCGPAWNACRNLEAAARRQGQKEWWETIKSNPTSLKKVVAAYHARVTPEVTGAKKAKKDAFCIAQYREEVRRFEALLKDGVFEMMNQAAYVHWAAKAKNGGLDVDDAKARFEDPRGTVSVCRGGSGRG